MDMSVLQLTGIKQKNRYFSCLELIKNTQISHFKSIELHRSLYEICHARPMPAWYIFCIFKA